MVEPNTIYYFGTSTTEAGHYFWEANGQRLKCKYLDFFRLLPFDPEKLPKSRKVGDVEFVRYGDFTVIAICGSPKDKRPGCKSVFFIKAYISFNDLKTKIFQTQPFYEIIAKMPFAIYWPVQSSDTLDGQPISHNRRVGGNADDDDL